MGTRLFQSSTPQTMRLLCASAMALAALCSAVASSPARAGETPPEDSRPLSAAQIALFETPHLRNVARAETLDYSYVREGPAGFTDKIALHIRRVNADGTKNVAFDYLTGERQVRFPELDNFQGNPLLMLALERDVNDMKGQVGLSTSYFRNKIREAFVTKAAVTQATFDLQGATVPAQVITVQPFEGDQRLERIPSLQAKTYSFVLADAVPGMLAEIRIGTPADTKMDAPAMSQRMTFIGVEP